MKTHLRPFISFVLLVSCAGSGCNALAGLGEKHGTEFKIQVASTDPAQNNIVQSAIRVTQTKLDLMKLDGQVIEDPADRTNMIVRVYSSKDLERTKEFLFTAYQLELRKVVSPPSPQPARTYPTAEAATKAATTDQEVFLYSERDAISSGPQQFVVLEKSVIVNGEDVRDARVVPSAGGHNYQISFSLRPQGAVAFGHWTGENIGNYIAVVLDKKVRSIAFIKSQIFDSGEINGRFTKESAEDIALSLRSGFLPATMKIIEEKPIGN